MFKVRNLLGVGIAVVVMLAIVTTGVFAHPVQQATVTPEATAAATEVMTPTETLTPTEVSSPASVAPAVSPLATPQATIVGTPSTLPTTGGSDDGSAALSFLVLALGAVILLGVASVALSRRTR